MEIQFQVASVTEAAVEAIIIGAYQETPLSGAARAVDEALGGKLSEEILQTDRFTGKAAESIIFQTYGALPARYVILMGLGDPVKLDNTVLRRANAAAIIAAKALRVKSIGCSIFGVNTIAPQQAARLAAEGALLGNYTFSRYKKTDAKRPEPLLEQCLFLEKHAQETADAIKDGLAQGKIIAQASNQARDLVFDSANHITPTAMAKFAQCLSEDVPGLTCKILEAAEVEQLGMGAFLSVSQGSDQPLKLIHMTYRSQNPTKKIALVGKGITFDSGGLSLKPSSGMEAMKMDMAGAAAVINTVWALAQLQCDGLEVHAIAPCCENMPNGKATKPGDIVIAMEGSSIEINNTDAEGRLVLCDALTYATQKIDPDLLIDLATLTGAAIVALGKETAAVMGTDDKLLTDIKTFGALAGEKYWPLPLDESLNEFLKSDVADLINSGSKGQAGTSYGGMFLKHFIREGQAWAHLDIAGPAYSDKAKPEVPKGATGFGVRTLIYLLAQLG
jgi:leucyl aminopeptidase